MSTEDAEIAEVAASYGAGGPGHGPPELAQDTTATEPVVDARDRVARRASAPTG